MSDRDRRLTVNVARVATGLRLSLLVDLLFELGLLLPEDYRYVRSLRDAETVKQESDLWTLAGFALRKKGREIFDIFCEVLRAVRGLAFTATTVANGTRGGSVNVDRPVSEDGTRSGDVREREVQPLSGATAIPLQSQLSQLSVAREVSGRLLHSESVGVPDSYPVLQSEPHPISWRLFYEMGRDLEDFRCWKKVAKNLGLTSQEIDHIKSEAKSSRKQTQKMLILWHSKVRRALGVSHDEMAVQQMAEQLQGMTVTPQTDPVPQQSDVLGAAKCGARDPSQSRQGWRCVYDTVKSHPLERIIQSVVCKCASEWYRLGLQLNYSDNEIQGMTYNIPSIKGKLQVIIERKSMEYEREDTVEMLLDACDQIMPLEAQAVLQDLGINCKYSNRDSDKALFDLADEVGVFWKEIALSFSIRADELDIIEKEASTTCDKVVNMLRLLHAKMTTSSVFNVDDIKTRLRKIKESKRLIPPENVEDDKKVCGREEELNEIFKTFWGNHHRVAGIPQFCLQVVSGLGGIGKSSVAWKYARLWKEWYGDGVLYFNGQS